MIKRNILFLGGLNFFSLLIGLWANSLSEFVNVIAPNKDQLMDELNLISFAPRLVVTTS